MKKYLPIGHQMKKPLRMKINGPWIISLNRNEAVTNINVDPQVKLNPVEEPFFVYEPEHWLKKANELFRGQPIAICEDEIVSYLNRML